MRSIIILACLAVTVLSCNKTAKETATSEPDMMKEVMAVHDELMPKMGEMGMLITKLENKAATAEAPEKYTEAKEGLQEGYDAMMTWMQDFGTRFSMEDIHKGKELSPEKKELLKEEMKSVKALKDKMLGSIKTAKEVLAANE